MPSSSTESRFRWLAVLMQSVLGVTLVVAGWTCGVVYVAGSSMEPALSAGDIAVYRRHCSDVAEGDIVLFDDEGCLVVHRVIEIGEDGSCRTQGDANRTADVTPVAPERLRGEIVAVVPTGDLLGWLAGRTH